MRQINKICFEKYSLELKHSKNKTTILMNLSIPEFMTESFPNTVNFLKESLPSIFQCNCNNETNSSFELEAKNTEIAHLFEHILIAYLFEEKRKVSNVYFKFDGITKWNSACNSSYKITLNIGKKDQYFFPTALKKSTLLLNKIISNKTGRIESA